MKRSRRVRIARKWHRRMHRKPLTIHRKKQNLPSRKAWHHKRLTMHEIKTGTRSGEASFPCPMLEMRRSETAAPEMNLGRDQETAGRLSSSLPTKADRNRRFRGPSADGASSNAKGRGASVASNGEKWFNQVPIRKRNDRRADTQGNRGVAKVGARTPCPAHA
jgi:hypothetical protein